MTKVKSVSGYFSVTTIVLYALLIAALSTYFMPVVNVNLSALGSKVWSVQDLVRIIPSGMIWKNEERQPLTAQYDFFDLVQELAPRQAGSKVTLKASPQFIAGALVPLALAGAYVLAILNLLLVPLRRNQVFTIVSIFTVACSGYVLFGMYYLDQVARRVFSESLAKVGESPFALIARNLISEVEIRPASGLFVLVGLTVLILLFAFWQRRQVAR